MVEPVGKTYLKSSISSAVDGTKIEKHSQELMQVVSQTVDQNTQAVVDAVDTLQLAAITGQTQVNEVVQDALKGQQEVTRTVDELTDAIRAQTEAIAPQAQQMVGSLRDAMDGNNEGMLHMLEGVVEPELIEETQQELIRFKSALKDIIEKMQQIALQAASQVEVKMEDAKTNAMDVAHNL